MERAIELKAITSATSEAPPQTTDFDMALNLVTCVRTEAGDCAEESLATVNRLIANVVTDPSNNKFRRLRLANPLIRDKIAQYDSCLALLDLVGFKRRAEANEEVLLAVDFKTDLARLLLDLLSTPQMPSPALARSVSQPVRYTNRADFLANVHEQRLQNKVNSNMAPAPANQRAPETFLQLQEYRKKQKSVHPNRGGIMTLADLERRDTVQASPVVDNHAAPDYGAARSIAIRAYQLTNEFRATQGLPPLTWNDGMALIGKGHSDDMAAGRVPFSHQGFNNRFRAFPFRFTRGGAENVAMNAGIADVAKVAVDGWINSPGHRKNMLGNFNYSGIGVTQGAQGAWYLTQLFALAH